MDITDGITKRNMLAQLAEQINPAAGEKNFFHFTDEDGEEVAEVSFKFANIEGGSSSTPSIQFLNGTNIAGLDGTIKKTGRVKGFFINMKGSDTERVVEGTVGIPTDLDADIKFNRIDWIKKNGIELSNVIITLENICLHQ